MKIQNVYVSDDGKVMGTMDKVKSYEDKINHKLKLEKEKESRKKEIDDKTRELEDLIQKYYDDYGYVDLHMEVNSGFTEEDWDRFLNFMDDYC